MNPNKYKMAKQKSKKPVNSTNSGCQTPKPKNQLTPNGYWSCVGGEWTWIEDLG